MARRHAVALVLLALGFNLYVVQSSSDSAKLGLDLCDPCVAAVTMLDDIVLDPDVEETLIKYAKETVCPTLAPIDGLCRNLTVTYIEAFFDYLKVAATPGKLCADVCPPKVQLFMAFQKANARAPRDGASCNVCLALMTNLKAVVKDEGNVERIMEEGRRFCKAIPFGLDASCLQYLEANEPVIIHDIQTEEPQELCDSMNMCAVQLAQRKPMAPLPLGVLQPIARLAALAQGPPAANGFGDVCSTCKVMVQEARTVVADPKFQAAVVDYAKELCTTFPSMADTCIAEIDQYYPLVFGSMLVYLQPDQVCTQLSMCPSPPARASVSSTAQAHSKAMIMGWKMAKASQVVRIMRQL